MYRPQRPRPTLPANVPAALIRRERLIDAGLTARGITDAVRDGRLLRSRRGCYLPGDCHPWVSSAVRAGGRVDCVSLLKLYGVFVLECEHVHVRLDPHASRVPACTRGMVRHWSADDADPDAVTTPLLEALVQSVVCQSARAAIATLDSAWNLRLVDEAGIAEVFRRLPRRYRRLRPLLDARAEAGTETFVRLMLRGLGVRPELQPHIRGVGFVDMLVDGWLIVECDSEAHHGDWRARLRDLRRDAAALAAGFVTLRIPAEDILFRPENVLAVLRAVLARGPILADERSQLRRNDAVSREGAASGQRGWDSPEL